MNLQAMIGWGVLGALAAVAVTAAIQTARLETANGDLREAQACLSAIPDETARPGAEAACAPPVAALVAQARLARLCQQALATGDVALLERACPAEVKRLDAQVATDRHTLASLQADLAQAAETQTQAVLRAEARGRSQAERDARAQAVRDAAPRDVDDLRVFDAGRLCERFETPPCA
ncbi:hypothetical protein [Phenylobacterium sp.]|uniref:hypothetical protein n=1 Tax=Phenylobacterium sp. TaxID=1871053 RepID=UPI002731D0FB|nr:hypothetical protein [Phenylobacterium sp.]MDP1617325.1 hypothetical protein [Phenylobacterium sp.]MDP1985697.1 hypothetical protein [Phenylobacterium sp.]